MAKNFKISFSGAGSVSQTIELVDGINLSREELQDGLRSGKYVTTIQEDGSVDVTATGEVIAKVVYVNNELEYSDFDVEIE